MYPPHSVTYEAITTNLFFGRQSLMNQHLSIKTWRQQCAMVCIVLTRCCPNGT